MRQHLNELRSLGPVGDFVFEEDTLRVEGAKYKYCTPTDSVIPASEGMTDLSR